MKGLKKFSKKKQKLCIKISKTTTRKKELKYKTYKSLFEKVRKKAKTTYYSNNRFQVDLTSYERNKWKTKKRDQISFPEILKLINHYTKSTRHY